MHWVRAFSSMEAREKLKDTFYDATVWNKQIEPLVTSMIDGVDAPYHSGIVMCQTGFVRSQFN